MRKFSALCNNSIGRCCLHSFYYIFLFTFTAAPASLTVVRSELTIPVNMRKYEKIIMSSQEPSFPGANVPGNFHSWERRFPLGTFAPRSENTGERKVLIPRLVYTSVLKYKAVEGSHKCRIGKQDNRVYNSGVCECM